MKFTMTKIAAALALATLASGAHAAQVVSMTLDDTLTLADTLGTDGYEGTFRINGLAGQNASGASQFKGDVNGGAIDVTQANGPYPAAANAFTTGFIFANAPIRPDITSAIDIDIAAGVMTVNSLPWGGSYEGIQFNMTPDAAPTYTLVATGANAYAYRMRFSHLITSADDPSLTYTGFNIFWILEGSMTTAVPEASTYGMMLAGLGLVGAAARRRRHRI